MHVTNLSLKEVYYRMSIFNPSWQILKWIESTNYARLKGNHMFIMTEEKLKTFPTILLDVRFAGLLRQEMYWDCYNPVVSAMMTKTERHYLIFYLILLANNAFWIRDIPSMWALTNPWFLTLGNMKQNGTYRANP